MTRRAATFAAVLALSVTGASCLIGQSPAIDEDRLVRVEEAPGQPFDGLYTWSTGTLLISSLPGKRYWLTQTDSSGVERYLASFVPWTGQADAPNSDEQAYLAVLEKDGTKSAQFMRLIFTRRSGQYAYQGLSIDADSPQVQAQLGAAGLTAKNGTGLYITAQQIDRADGTPAGIDDVMKLPAAVLKRNAPEPLRRLRPVGRPAPIGSTTFAGATPISPKAFLDQLREVDLDVQMDTETALTVSSDRIERSVESRLRLHGLEISPLAEVTAQIDVSYLVSDYNPNWPIHQVIVHVRFELPGAIVRGPRVSIIDAAPAWNFRWVGWIGDGSATRIANEAESAVDKILDQLWSNEQVIASPASPVTAAFAQQATTLLRDGDFTAGSYEALRSLPDISVDQFFDASRWIDSGLLQSTWRAGLARAGLPAGSGSYFRYHLLVQDGNASMSTALLGFGGSYPFNYCTSSTDLVERNVVFLLNDRFVRADAQSTWFHKLAVCGARTAAADIRKNVAEDIDGAVARIVGRTGR